MPKKTIYFTIGKGKKSILLVRFNHLLVNLSDQNAGSYMQVKIEGLEDRLAKKKAQIAILVERTSEVRKMKEELQQKRSEVLINMNVIFAIYVVYNLLIKRNIHFFS